MKAFRLQGSLTYNTSFPVTERGRSPTLYLCQAGASARVTHSPRSSTGHACTLYASGLSLVDEKMTSLLYQIQSICPRFQRSITFYLTHIDLISLFVPFFVSPLSRWPTSVILLSYFLSCCPKIACNKFNSAELSTTRSRTTKVEQKSIHTQRPDRAQLIQKIASNFVACDNFHSTKKHPFTRNDKVAYDKSHATKIVRDLVVSCKRGFSPWPQMF